MKTNKKIIICTLILLTLFCIMGTVSANESISDKLAKDTNHNTFSVDDSQSTISDTNSHKVISSSNKNKQMRTKNEEINKKTNTTKLSDGKNIVKDTTISQFFDNEGYLKDSVTYNNLTFEGKFKNRKFTINKAITLTGKNAIMTNTAFKIVANNVKISNFTFIANKIFNDTNSIIYSEGKNTIIQNNHITYNAPNTGDAYAINMNSANNLKLINNNIDFNGALNKENNHKTIVIYAITSNKLNMKNNNITAKIPSIAVDYDPVTWEPVVLSATTLLEKCENIKLENNNIITKYNQSYGGYYDADTLYGVKILEGNNAQINTNTIKINGHKYTYGLFANGNNITITNNTIKSGSNNMYSCGIQIDSHSTADLENNILSVKSNDVTYGIYSEGYDWQDSTAKNTLNIKKNKVAAQSNTAYGVMLSKNNARFIKNDIITKANYTTALGIKNGEVKVINNKIVANGTNTGNSTDTMPMVPVQTTGIAVINSKININSNDITSTSKKTIDLNQTNGTIINNKLNTANGAKGDKTITKVDSKVTLDNNKSSEPIIAIKVISKKIMYEGNYQVQVTADGKSVGAGKTVQFQIGKQKINKKTNAKGYATIKLSQSPGKYKITTIYSNKKDTSQVAIQHAIVAKNLKVKKSAKQLNIKVPLKKLNKKVQSNKTLTLSLNGEKYRTKTNNKGVAIFKIVKKSLQKLKVGKKYTYAITYKKDTLKRTLSVGK